VTAAGHPTAQVARDLGITPNLLRRWKQEVTGDPVAAFPGKGRRKPHAEELARLKRELARVTQERDFLKSVAAYFAKPSS
jgi:transposase